jgi:hypothetical protein
MIFHDRFVSQSELTDFLAAADIYVTPYLKAEQITSGTLAYASVAAGGDLDSLLYARELLAEGRGVVVPWRDPGAIAREVIDLLGNDQRRLEMGEARGGPRPAHAMAAVARSYMQTFERACHDHTARLRAAFQARTLAERPAEPPRLNLEHLGHDRRDRFAAARGLHRSFLR